MSVERHRVEDDLDDLADSTARLRARIQRLIDRRDQAILWRGLLEDLLDQLDMDLGEPKREGALSEMRRHARRTLTES